MDKGYFSYCEDEAVKVKVEGMPVHRFFAPAEFLMYGMEPSAGNFDNYVQIVDMPIDEFIGLAEPIPEDDEKRHAPQGKFRQDVLNGEPTNWDIPYLTIKENEDGIWKVVGHDGRHRGMLLQSIGYSTMPVRLDIQAQMNEELLPDALWCQNDKSVKRDKDFYPFPITEENYMQPYVSLSKGVSVLDGGTSAGVVMDEDVYPAGCDSKKLKDYLGGKDLETTTMDGAGKAPEPCLAAKRNFVKNFVPNPAYRKDNVMPGSNLKEYLERHGK